MKINFLVNNLAPGQLGFYLGRNLNEAIEQHRDLSPSVFFEQVMPLCVKPKFPYLNMAEAYGVKGPTIATNAVTAERLIHMFGPKLDERYFYVWDLEWLRGQQRPYIFHSNIMTNRDLKLIVRGAEHAKLIKNCFNREVEDIVEDFNSKELVKIINRDQNQNKGTKNE